MAAATDLGYGEAWRVSFRRARRADARADPRETSAPVLLAGLTDCRADLAQPLPCQRRSKTEPVVGSPALPVLTWAGWGAMST